MIHRRSFLQSCASGCFAAAAVSVPLRASETDAKVREFETRIFDRINELRVECGAPALEWREAIWAAARDQSARKAELQFPGHVDPQRGDIAQRLTARGLLWSRCGENLFFERGYADPVNLAVVCWWYSAGHRENLLNADYLQSAVGIALDQDDRIFATQIFVTPPASGPRMQKSPANHVHRASKPELLKKLFGRS